jgi:hypothetical protein
MISPQLPTNPRKTCEISFAVRFGFVLSILLISVSRLPAQELEAKVRGKLEQANFLYSSGKLAEAGQIFVEVLDDSEDCKEAHFGLGEIYFRQKEWSKSIDRFHDYLNKEPANLRAHYCSAIAYRELGTQAALVMRGLRWSNAQEHFDAVVVRDSSYEDVLFQAAKLQSYRENILNAITLTRQQLRLKPTLLNAQLGLMKFYGDYIRLTRVEEALPWLEAQQTEFAVYFTGELYRRKKRDLQADTLFSQLLSRVEELPKQAPLLSLVRLFARQNKAERLEQLYWQAVNEANSQFGIALLFNDIKFLLTDEELTQFDSLESLKDKVVFFRSFWTRRNPTPASNLNQRLLEHYQRLVYAESNYEYRRVRIHFTNPDQHNELRYPKAYALNEEFNDKGLIYLRYGEPDFSNQTGGDIPLPMDPGEIGFNSPVQQASGNEVWVYEGNRSRAQMIFHFVLFGSAGGNWRLSPLPTDARAFEFLSTWDNRYFSYLNRGEGAREGIRDEITKENQQTVFNALSAERPTAKKDFYRFTPPIAVDAFRGQRGKTSLDISYALPLTILAQRISTEEANVRWTISVTLRNRRGEVAQTMLDSLTVHVTKESRGAVVDLFRTTINPDSFSVSLYLESPDLKMIGEATAKSSAHNFEKTDLQLSDIQFLLESPLKPKMEVEGVKVVPSPFRRVGVDRPFRLYHHLYHLRKSGSGKTQWGVEYILAPVQLKDRSAKQSPIVFSLDKNGTEEFADQYFPFNATNAKPGIYQLTVRATDRISEATAERRVLMELY